MICRTEHFKTIMERTNKLATSSIIMKRFSVSVQDGPLNATRNKSYLPEKIDHCDIKFEKEQRETAAGQFVEIAAKVWVYDPEFTYDERDSVNIGGIINGSEVTGGDDYRIAMTEPYEDCVKLLLRTV